MNIFFAILKILKFPLKLLTNWLGSKQKKTKTEQEKKQLDHVRNFDPARLKNKSWQIRSGKKLTKKQREYYRKKAKKIKK